MKNKLGYSRTEGVSMLYLISPGDMLIKAVLHKLGDGLLKQIPDVVHATDVCQLQQLSDLGSAFIFFRGTIPS